MNDKTTLELEIDDQYRQIKEKDEEKQNILNLKLLELNNIKSNHEKKIQDRSNYINQLQ